MFKVFVEGQFGHGGKPKRVDLRDHKWKKIASAPVPFDWSVGYDPQDTNVTKNQGQSDSCGGQSGAYLNARLLGGEEQSAKSIYSLIWYKGGGTSLRDVLKTICNRGVNLEVDVPSTPPFEPILEDKSWVKPNLDHDAGIRKGLSYAFVNADIESTAQAIRDTGGCVLMIEGQNNGSWLSPVPIAPNSNVALWRHFVFAGGAKLLNGKKAIHIHNSWGNGAGENGWQWITEDYFNSGHVTEAGVLYKVPTSSNIPQTQKTPVQIAILQKLINLYYLLIDKVGMV